MANPVGRASVSEQPRLQPLPDTLAYLIRQWLPGNSRCVRSRESGLESWIDGYDCARRYRTQLRDPERKYQFEQLSFDTN